MEPHFYALTNRSDMRPGLKAPHAFAALCIILSVRLAQAQGTIRTVTFDGPPVVAPGSDIGFTYYYENGMTFSPINDGEQFVRSGGGREGFPQNGTGYILNGFFTSFSGSRSSVRFGLSSVDLAEFSTFYNFPRIVQFIGYRFDGSVVTAEFTTDGIIDGTGTLPDFQTFYFDNRFSDLVRFEVPSSVYALDNLVFSNVVPEPGTGALGIVAAAVFGLRRFRRRRRPTETSLTFTP